MRERMLSVVCAAALAGGTAMGQGTVPEAAAGPAGKPVHLAVDFSKSVGVYKPIYSWFGYDEAQLHDDASRQGAPSAVT